MNPSFDFGRWGLLVRQHWIENKKRYLLSIVAMAGILFMWFSFVALMDSGDPMDPDVQRGTYFFLLVVSGCFYASQFYRDLGSRSRAINYLLIPASSFERLMVSLLYAVVLFFLAFTAIYYLVDAIMVMAVNMFHPSYTEANANGAIRQASVVNVFGRTVGKVNGTPLFFAAYFAIQAAFLLGSVYFEKYSFVKTVISLFAVLLGLWLINSFLFEAILPEGGMNGIGSFVVTTNESENAYLVELPAVMKETLGMLVKWIFPIFFWVVTYFRLREKEV